MRLFKEDVKPSAKTPATVFKAFVFKERKVNIVSDSAIEDWRMPLLAVIIQVRLKLYLARALSNKQNNLVYRSISFYKFSFSKLTC